MCATRKVETWLLYGTLSVALASDFSFIMVHFCSTYNSCSDIVITDNYQMCA